MVSQKLFSKLMFLHRKKKTKNYYDGLFPKYKDYIDTFNALYQLKSNDENEINKIYQMIKTNLIDTSLFTPSKIIYKISMIIQFNNCFLQSYWKIIKRIYDEFHPNQIDNIPTHISYFFYKEYGVILRDVEKIDFESSFYRKDFSLFVHEDKTIYSAIMNDDKEHFIVFINEEGFDQNQTINNDFYPSLIKELSLLELCCYHGAVDCFKILRSKFKSEITQKCLELSFLGGKPDIISECLKYQEPKMTFCMKYAIVSHNIDFVSFLMNEHYEFINLIDCGKYNNLQAFFIYLDQTENINESFVYSPYFEIPSLIEYFIQQGADINFKENISYLTALHNASINNSKEIAQLLIHHGADINAKNCSGNTALFYSVKEISKEMVEFFIHNGINVNIENFVTLYYLCGSRNMNIIELLVSSGININSVNKNGQTVLHEATIFSQVELASFLISHGANVNIRDNTGKTPLHLAGKSPNPFLVKLFIEHGADINAKDNEGKTVIHYASEIYITQVLQILIPNGVDINATVNNGKTALHIASERNMYKIVKYLILNGADITIRDKNRKMALDLAKEKNHKKIADILNYPEKYFKSSRGLCYI